MIVVVGEVIKVDERKIQHQVITSSVWLSERDLLVFSPIEPEKFSSQLKYWNFEKRIFYVWYQGRRVYPDYAFDVSWCPVSGLQPVLQAFGASKNSWGLAYWFAGHNGHLGGKRPQDLLCSHSDLVLNAANDEMRGITHG